MNPTFTGEHLRPGQLGHFFVILALVGALFSLYSYWRSARAEVADPFSSRSWLTMGRVGFGLHFVSIIGIFTALYYIITRHLFEYNYAWEHSNKALPMKYLLSCFWEGQEGSFMLWTFWQSVLGLIVIRTARNGMESRVMVIVSLMQVCLCTMLLGMYLGPDIKIGSTPFILLRNKMANAPIFSDPNYLVNFIHDGNGLNVSLQNYWMTIHPPVLFLGFATTMMPFAYVIAALWKGDYKAWVRPALNWSLFSGGVLGLGIMMGGAWAYESLTFGGYWAWDPVENASLVPWLALIAGLHMLLVYKATGRNLFSTCMLLLLAHLLVWYSTFLTRTGILGKTSVHAFTGEGQSLTWHLLIVIGVLLLLCILMLIYRRKELPRVRTEEKTSSREFWMFIGSFVLLLSSLHIITATSLPVWSPLVTRFTGKEPAIEDPARHYNNIEVWVAIVVALLSATTLFIKFKQTDLKSIVKRFGITISISLVLAILIGIGQHITTWQYDILLFAATYAVVANLYYMFGVQRGSFLKRGAAFSHFGFGLMLLGMLLSSYGKQVISFNTTGELLNFGKKTMAENAAESRENVMMFRGAPTAMGEYYATYLGDSTAPEDPRLFYRVAYERHEGGKITERFNLYPDLLANNKGMDGRSPNPASKHYWTHDMFTYINATSDPSVKDTTSYKEHTMHVGDTVFISNGYMVFKGFDRDAVHLPQGLQADISVAARLYIYNTSGLIDSLHPVFYIRGNETHSVEDTLSTMAFYTRFTAIMPEQNAAVIQTKQTTPQNDWIVLKAILFPYINVLWFGTLIMVAGFMLSMLNRILEKKKKATNSEGPFQRPEA